MQVRTILHLAFATLALAAPAPELNRALEPQSAADVQSTITVIDLAPEPTPPTKNVTCTSYENTTDPSPVNITVAGGASLPGNHSLPANQTLPGNYSLPYNETLAGNYSLPGNITTVGGEYLLDEGEEDLKIEY